MIKVLTEYYSVHYVYHTMHSQSRCKPFGTLEKYDTLSMSCLIKLFKTKYMKFVLN